MRSEHFHQALAPDKKQTPPPLEGGGRGEGLRAARTPPPSPLPQGEGEYPSRDKVAGFIQGGSAAAGRWSTRNDNGIRGISSQGKTALSSRPYALHAMRFGSGRPRPASLSAWPTDIGAAVHLFLGRLHPPSNIIRAQLHHTNPYRLGDWATTALVLSPGAARDPVRRTRFLPHGQPVSPPHRQKSAMKSSSLQPPS